jgi:hypothetical protein
LYVILCHKKTELEQFALSWVTWFFEPNKKLLTMLMNVHYSLWCTVSVVCLCMTLQRIKHLVFSRELIQAFGGPWSTGNSLENMNYQAVRA